MEDVIADNVTIDTLCGCPVIATDCIGGVHYEIVKAAFGVADTATQVSACDPFPVTLISTTPDLMLGTDFSNVLGTASLILGTQADCVANTSDGLQTTSFLYGFDGTIWDRLRSTNGELHIHDGCNSITVDGSLTVDLGCNNDVTVTSGSITADLGCNNDVVINTRTTGGTSFFYSNDLDESEEQVKGSASTLYSLYAWNSTNAPLYLKIFNKLAACVTVGTTAADIDALVPGNACSDGAGFIFPIPTQGMAFGTGLTMAMTTGVGATNSGTPGANAGGVFVGYA